MDIYCTLEINSKTQATLPNDLFLAKAKPRIEFTDNEWAERVARRERWRSAGMSIRPDLPRYWWQLCSNKFVVSDDIHAHLVWILGYLRKGRLLCNLDAADYSYLFSVFWGASNGTGGGPLIAISTAELLILHKAKLAIGFYVAQ